ncbi:hypothetical protein NADFUDRAFT_51733 [Nadsonia fulvescens var. elongata DSM 6958]|uniref:Uncharacterized protein n=1 Tax=Nadsonia fulvescens var. elongata DSM 6958 TaxID=857566 RepID=A0A1E3PI75_9ASCO|nr:hypothetical protein NADFUDRAFT_51733 [Nadsonia fulvescens var. elongata DSM 6958]
MFRRPSRQVPFQETSHSDLNTKTINVIAPLSISESNILEIKQNVEPVNSKKEIPILDTKVSTRRVVLSRVHSLARPKLIQMVKTGWKERHYSNEKMSEIIPTSNSTESDEENERLTNRKEIKIGPMAKNRKDEINASKQVTEEIFYNRNTECTRLEFAPNPVSGVEGIQPEALHMANNRILYFVCIPKFFSVNSILAQVCGGPLERITNLRAENINSQSGRTNDTNFKGKTRCERLSETSRIELHFMEPEHAQNFYKFTQSGRFIINGHVCQPKWTNHASRPLPSYVRGHMIYRSARRGLVMTLSVLSTPKNEEEYVLDLRSIRADFGSFGTLVAITPLLGSPLEPTKPTPFKLAIDYTDVRYAIAARYAFDNEKSLADYRAHWELEFRKDITDRPCPATL